MTPGKIHLSPHAMISSQQSDRANIDFLHSNTSFIELSNIDEFTNIVRQRDNVTYSTIVNDLSS